MAKRKVGLLAQVLAITDQLSLEEIKTLSDTLYLKLLGEKKMSKSESKPERKPSQKRKAGKEATTITTDDDNPGTCGYRGCDLGPDENVHHMQSHPHYHEFGPAGEARGATGGN